METQGTAREAESADEGQQTRNLWGRLLSGHREEIKPEHNLWGGFLPEGCRRCLLGGRLCLTLGERCPKDCYYCSNPMGTDQVRADEFNLYSDEDLIRLVRLSVPDAVCLTGGEPSLYMDRAIRYARLLRQECGPDFHIQFFTANAELTVEEMGRVREAGADEIRCHLFTYKEAHLVSRAKELDWTVAVEIPCIPAGETTRRIVERSIELGAAFVNLHELLYSGEENFLRVAQRTGMEPGEPICRKVPFIPQADRVLPGDIHARLGSGFRPTRGSRELGLEMIELTRTTPGCTTAVHFCSAASKYLTQTPNRLARKARRLRRPFEDVSPDGTLVSTVIRCPGPELQAVVRERMERQMRIPPDKVWARGDLLFAPWTVMVRKAVLGELLPQVEISLSERYPVPEDVVMSEDGMYLAFRAEGAPPKPADPAVSP